MTTITLRSARTTASLLLRPSISSSRPTAPSSYRFASSLPTTPPVTHEDSASGPRSSVNGPLSTHPAPLSLPERKPDQSFFPGYAFSLGKAYLTFYKTGVKAIWVNFKACRPIQSHINDKYKSSVSAAIEDGYLNREKFQLLQRNSFDLKRVPVFALVFLVFGEFTPLVVIGVPGIVPYVCRIPRQINGGRKKLEERRSISFRNLTEIPGPEAAKVEKLDRMQLLHTSWSLGLSSAIWDYLGGQLPGLPTSILRKKVANRVTYLMNDDALIRNSGGVEEMDTEEVRWALVERGVDILEKKDEGLRGLLQSWLDATEHEPRERLFLTR